MLFDQSMDFAICLFKKKSEHRNTIFLFLNGGEFPWYWDPHTNTVRILSAVHLWTSIYYIFLGFTNLESGDVKGSVHAQRWKLYEIWNYEIINWSNLVIESWWAASSTHILPLLEGTAAAFSTSILPVWCKPVLSCSAPSMPQLHSFLFITEWHFSPWLPPAFSRNSCMPGFTLLSNNLYLISPFTRLMHSISSSTKHFAHQLFMDLC